MPDSTVDVKITADASGFDDKIGQARLAMQQARQSASQLRSELSDLSTVAERTGGVTEAMGARMRQVASDLAHTEQAGKESAASLKKLFAASGELGGGMANLGQELRHGVALVDEFARGARGQMVSSLVAAARDSGYLGTAIAALKGPLGIALAAAVAFAGGLYLIVRRANEAEAALRGVYNASLLMGGVSARGAEAGARAAINTLSSTNVMGAGSIDKFVQEVYSLGGASDQAKQKLVSLGPALYLALDQNDKALEKYVEHFKDVSSLRSFIEQQGMATQAQAAEVDQAVKAKDADTLRAIALDTLTQRLSGATAKIKEVGAATSSVSQVLAAGAAASMGMPGALANLTLPHRLPETPAGANPQAIQQALEWQEKYNKVANETAVIEQNIAAMTKARATATTDAARKMYDTMIADARNQEAALKPEGVGQIKQLQATLDRQLAASKANKEKRLALEIQYWQQVLATAQLSSAERIEIEEKISRAQIQQTDAGIAAAKRGAREAGAAAKKGYEDFAAAERDKIAEARGDWARISTIYAQWLARAKAQFGEASTQWQHVHTEMVNAARQAAQEKLRLDEESVNAEEAHNRVQLRAFEAAEKEKVAQKKITIQQMYAADIQYTAELAAEDKKRLEDVIKTDAMTVAERQKLNDQLTTISLDAADKIQGYQAQAAEASAKSWQQQFTKIEDQMASLAGDVLTRTKTIGQAFDDLAQSILKDLAGSAIKSALNSLLGIGGGGSGGGGGGGLGSGMFNSLFGSLFGGGLSSLFAAGGPLGIPTTGLTGLLQGDQDFSSALAGGGGLFSSIGGLFGGGGGGISSLLSFLPLLAFSKGGIVPSAARGWSAPSLGPGGALAKVHSREMVLPREISEGLQAAIAGGGIGGGHTFNIGINALDAKSVARMFQSNGGALIAALRSAVRNGAAAFG